MDDLISRQAALDEIEYELEMINSALDSITLDFNARERLRQRRGEAREMLNSIQQLPSAQPMRKKGKWDSLGSIMDVGDGEEIQCNKCKATYTIVYRDGDYNFCPNCGEYMRGETDG